MFKTSHKTNVLVELPFGAQERNAFDQPFGGQVPVGTGKAGGFSALPSGADPGTEQQTKGTDPRTGSLKRER